jgi:hypothetical protein
LAIDGPGAAFMRDLAQRLLLAIALAGGACMTPAWADADDASGDATGASEPAPPSGGQQPESRRMLPFLAEEAIKRGHELPLPFGAGLILTGLGNRKIDVTDVRVGLQNPPRSVSNFLSLGATSDVFNANVKFDAWLPPILDVYALLGYVHNQSTTDALITVPVPGPGPGSRQFEQQVKTELDGVVGGVGFAIATGYQNFFLVLDAAYIQSDLGFDNKFKATIATVRAGYRGRIGTLPLQMWLGVGDWDTAATATGHADLGNAGQLSFEADQRPHTRWMYDLGSNLEISKRLQLVLDVGADFDGGLLHRRRPHLPILSRVHYQPMLRPPSTARIWPVTYGASAAKNRQLRATSSAEPARLRAVRLMIFSCSARSMASAGHSTGPGATALTRTCGPSSRASALVSMRRPALATLYTG